MEADRAAMETESLIEGCLRGDRHAQHVMFNRYRRLILGVVYRMFGPQSRCETEDTVQNVYVELFRTLRLFKGQSSLDTWVYRISSRVCLMQMRRKYRKGFLLRTGPRSSPEELEDTTYDPVRRLDSRELLGKIYRALDGLAPERRAIFILFEVEGKSIGEIAAILDKPDGTVKSNLFRARKELESRLCGYVSGNDPVEVGA